MWCFIKTILFVIIRESKTGHRTSTELSLDRNLAIIKKVVTKTGAYFEVKVKRTTKYRYNRSIALDDS